MNSTANIETTEFFDQFHSSESVNAPNTGRMLFTNVQSEGEPQYNHFPQMNSFGNVELIQLQGPEFDFNIEEDKPLDLRMEKNKSLSRKDGLSPSSTNTSDSNHSYLAPVKSLKKRPRKSKPQKFQRYNKRGNSRQGPSFFDISQNNQASNHYIIPSTPHPSGLRRYTRNLAIHPGDHSANHLQFSGSAPTPFKPLSAVEVLKLLKINKKSGELLGSNISFNMDYIGQCIHLIITKFKWLLPCLNTGQNYDIPKYIRQFGVILVSLKQSIENLKMYSIDPLKSIIESNQEIFSVANRTHLSRAEPRRMISNVLHVADMAFKEASKLSLFILAQYFSGQLCTATEDINRGIYIIESLPARFLDVSKSV